MSARRDTLNRPLTVLFVPLERQSDGTVHRGSNMIEMLRRRYTVLGLERDRGFGSGALFIRSVRMLLYWARVVGYGLRHRRSIDVLFCENTHAFLGSILSKLLGRPCIWDIEGEDALYLDAWEKSVLFRWLVLGSHTVTKRLCRLLIVPCEEDREAYVRRGYCAKGLVATVPLVLDLARLPRAVDSKAALRRRLGLDPEKTILIYTGQRTEAPYRAAAEWICRELAAGLGPLLDRVLILLTGRGEVIPTSYPQIRFTGFVPSVLDYVAAADVGLVPVWREAGVPGKMIEYMALGKPFVISSRLRGLQHLEDGVNAMVAGSPEEFVRKVAYLIQNPRQAARMGARARQTAEQHYSYEVAVGPLWRLVEGVAAGEARS
jgi:glycosyltransferase involved in cell wall biosynthesis